MKKKVLIASFFAMLMLTVPLSSITIAEDQISGEQQELEGEYLVVQQTSNLIPLTEDEINYLLDAIDDIEDEPTRLIAHEIVDRFITEDGELDTLGLQNVLNEYGTTGIFAGIIQLIIQWIISSIRDEVMSQITGIISWWLLESLSSEQLGWLIDPNGPITYTIESTALLNEIKSILGKWVGALQTIKQLPETIGAFLSDIRVITFVLFLKELKRVKLIVEDLIENFPAELEIVKEDVLELCNKTIDFYNFIFPENEEDIPYNKSIIVKGKIDGISPNDVEIHCDGQTYSLNADGTFEAEFITTNKEVDSYLWHSIRIAIYNSTTGDYSEIYETAFSRGTVNKTFSFSGRPMKPVGPTENVSRFTTQLYKSYAIDSDGGRLEYQWSWNGNEGPWSSDHASGSDAFGLKFWLDLGENEVKVRSRNSNGDVSDWSETLTVTVIRRFIQGTSYMQQLQTIVLQSYPSSPASQSTTQPGSSQSTTTQQSTTSL